MATITRYCMRKSDFRRIVAMQECHIKSTNKFGERKFKNTNDLEVIGSKYYYPGCIGVKTGFTSQAQNCLISAVSKNNLQLIAVVLHCSLTDDKKSARYVDSKTLFDYAYSTYTFKEIAKTSAIVNRIEVKGGSKETKVLDLTLQDSITALVNKNSTSQIVPEIKLNNNISAPIAQNVVLGQAVYTIDGQSYTTNLLASHNVEKDESTILYLRIALGIVIFSIFIILVIILLVSVFRHKKKKQETEFKDINDKEQENCKQENETKNQIMEETLEEQNKDKEQKQYKAKNEQISDNEESKKNMVIKK